MGAAGLASGVPRGVGCLTGWTPPGGVGSILLLLGLGRMAFTSAARAGNETLESGQSKNLR